MKANFSLSKKQLLPPVLTSGALKWIALITMFIDHIGAIILEKGAISAYNQGLPSAFSYDTSVFLSKLDFFIRQIGRISFPIFCFLLVEGFYHTSNRKKYALRLFLFACISEIPWNFAQNGTLLYPDKQNVFFTLFLGYLAFCLVEHFEKNASMQLVCMLLLLAVSYFLKADYGYKGFVFLLIMYWLHQHKPAQAVIGSCWLIYEWKACFAFIPLNMYNNKRGFIQGKWVKYLFYAFYPVHIAILTVIRKMWFGI